MNPLAPIRQSVWGKLAVSNFLFGGAGGGLYVLAMGLGVMGLGHGLPVLLILAGVGFPGSLPVMVVIAGMAIVVGEILLKDAVVRQAGYLVGIGVPLRAAYLLKNRAKI